MIETKFCLGDKVQWQSHGEVYEGVVTQIDALVNVKRTKCIRYLVELKYCKKEVLKYENELFPIDTFTPISLRSVKTKNSGK
jgi:hypothetical protein